MMNLLQTCILISFVVNLLSAIDEDEDRKVFVAYMGLLLEGEYSPSLHHHEILKNISSPRFASKALIRSYQRSFNGFAAYLSQEEQQKLAAWEMDPSQSLDAELAYGSGHIDPHKAKDPGLVYDTSKEDYHKIWCSISQSKNSSCHANLTVRELNYPSMGVEVDINSEFVVSFPRTVTNVGKADSRYVASIQGGSTPSKFSKTCVILFVSILLAHCIYVL